MTLTPLKELRPRGEVMAQEAFHYDRPIKNVFDYGRQKIRGVNIGGWLVTEPWITPSIYDTGNPSIIDEYTFCEHLGRAEALRRLTSHWKSFYTETDFHRISSYGLNHVRIPIGYWAFDVSDGEPYVQGQFQYLKLAIGWARRAGLRVMIDLHGAPGSQNGFDNSGRRGDIGWADKQSNVARTKAVLAKLTEEFAQERYAGVVTSIEALNEPAGFKDEVLVNTTKQFYRDAYEIVRHPSHSNGQETNLLVSVHDAFLPLTTWSHFFPYPTYQGVALDTHIYTVFTIPGIRMSDADRIKAYCDMIPSLQSSQQNIWTFVGEFTPAPTDCAPLLNGLGKGARYDGTFDSNPPTGSCEAKSGLASTFSQEYKEILGRLFEVQTTVFEYTSGWFMWTFKAENADDWSYDAGVKGGWIPRNPKFKRYDNPCQ